MGGPRLEDFSGSVGESWEVEAGASSIPLQLTQAQPLPRSMREEGAFRLEWVGPGHTYLPQAIYRFRRAGGELEMFIVPIAREGDSLRYEAIFS